MLLVGMHNIKWNNPHEKHSWYCVKQFVPQNVKHEKLKGSCGTDLEFWLFWEHGQEALKLKISVSNFMILSLNEQRIRDIASRLNISM